MKGDYQKKIKQCEKLGALQFQKVVFKVEDIKFKVLKKLWFHLLWNMPHYYIKHWLEERS